MLKDFLREVVTLVAGKQAEEIADLINNPKHKNEFIIAKKMDLTINQTRNVLYKIADHGLVSSIRKKDKRKGWYTYFWKIEILKSLEFLKAIIVKRLNEFQHQIKSRESKQFYWCERCKIEFNEEHALLKDFMCNECGDIFTLKDNTKILRDLRRNFTKLKNELAEINSEIEKEEAKIEKQNQKELVKIKKEKDLAKKVAAVARKNKKVLKDSINKKVKKPVKKKVMKKKKVVKKKLVKKKVMKKNVIKKIAKKSNKKKVVNKKAVKKKSVGKKILKKFKKINLKKTSKKKSSKK